MEQASVVPSLYREFGAGSLKTVELQRAVEAATSVQQFAESDSTWVGVVNGEIGFEEFLCIGNVLC
jgi:hypothetical protein